MAIANDGVAARDPSARISVRVTAVVAAILTVALAVLSYATLQIFVHQITPELERKGEIIAETINSQIERGLENGIPLQDLRGMDAFVAEVVSGHEEVGLIRLADADGGILYDDHFGRVAGNEVALDALTMSEYPVQREGETVAVLTLGIDPGYVASRLLDIGYDVAIALLVALIITFEILVLVIGVRIMTPIRALREVLVQSGGRGFRFVLPRAGRDEVGHFVQRVNRIIHGLPSDQGNPASTAAGSPGLAGGAGLETGVVAAGTGAPLLPRLRLRLPSDVRMPLFLFFFATELSRPFLPLFSEAVYAPVPFISREVAITLPIVVYLGLVAILSPFSGAWVARWGARKTFLYGLAPTLIGLVMSGLAGTLYELVFWRALSALGFALTTIAALTYIAQTSQPEARARAMVIYTVAFVTAGICGTAIGGILADRIGYGPTFLVGGIIAALAALLVTVTLPTADSEEDAATRRDRVTLAGFWEVLTNRRFLTLIGLASIPTQAISTGYLFFALPLLLDQLGYSASVIGRVMMIYFIVMAFASRPLAEMADKLKRHGQFVAAGLILAGVAGVMVLAVDIGTVVGWEAWLLAFSALLVGIAHALCIPAQGALLFALAEQGKEPSSAAISVFRLLERVGSVAGPLVIAGLIGWFSYAESIAILGAVLLMSGLVFATVHRGISRPSAPPAQQKVDSP